jgi:hypothetical protein
MVTLINSGPGIRVVIHILSPTEYGNENQKSYRGHGYDKHSSHY